MSESKIEWTEQTWNPIVGCSKVSAGCKNCYAERMAWRLACMQTSLQRHAYVGTATKRGWTGETHFVESALSIPLKRKKATMYFVCSMSDLFHESVPFEWIDKVFAVMALCPQHTFQVLTKRPARMAEYFRLKPVKRIMTAARQIATGMGPKIMNEAGVMVYLSPTYGLAQRRRIRRWLINASPNF